MAISRLPGSIAVAIIGIFAGQIYRSDLANLNAYRVSPTTVKLCSRFVLPLLGSLRPPRRSNRALPDQARITPRRASNDEVITTARPSSDTAAPRTLDPNEPGTGRSVVREWVNELTGRAERSTVGIHVPSEPEILELTTIFPNVRREVIVSALQRR
jgi:hypothetical protein